MPMNVIKEGLEWSGSGATSSLFLIARPGISPSLTLEYRSTCPSEIRIYELEDLDDILHGYHLIEYDAIVDSVPDDLREYLVCCLNEALLKKADVAWFGFEGSFDFSSLLAPEIAPQLYAIADATGVATATDDSLGSDAWKDRIATARNSLHRLE